MSRRIEIELTSARPDGTWTWRAAGAREPKGVLDGAVLPAGAAVGDVLRAEAEAELDGLTIVSVTPPKGKAEKSGLLEILPSSAPFEAVTQQLATRDRSDRPRRDRDRADRPRRDGDRPRRDGADRPRREGCDRPRGEGDRGPRPPREGGERRERRERRPSFTPPPEVPQRPKPKRLKPGRAHRNAVLADLPEEQRPVAELALQGMAAVRQRVREDNARLKAEGKPEMPEASVLKMAEDLTPRLRVAEWLDRADAAQRDIDDLDLRDLRSVVTAAEDPVVARDETTREIASALKQALVVKQEREYQNWLEDIDAALAVGRVIRALKISGQPPKAGVPFPAEAAAKLAQATLEGLSVDATPERWSALLEAAAFSPVRSQITPAEKPSVVNDDLVTTVTRLAPLLPAVAALFGVQAAPSKVMPKPLRPTRPDAKGKAAPRPAAAPKAAPAVAAEPPAAEVTPAPETPAAETPAAESPAAEAEAAETPAAETPAVEVEAAETPVDVVATDDADADDPASEEPASAD